ncbi:MAG TPA: N-acetylneuraminate synthase family protein [Candidatus Methylomirabilis sp.]|nr:N-acetylneuraminate synthase family protein [Candidatus Methylomirabilis sp.]
MAKRLIDAVFACQWNCVKFQKREPDICVPENQKNMIRDTPWGKMTYLEYKKRMEFGRDEYDYIDKYCKEKPIDWTASVWDTPSLEFIAQYDVPFIKIPSAKITEKELIKKACLTGKTIILSTGMSTTEEIDEAVKILEDCSAQYILLHTNSAYPTPANELNLRCIMTLKKRYNCIVGYSGHEYDLEPTVCAVSLGAMIIERHITLDHKMWGTDQSSSVEVTGMDMLAKRVKNISIMLGNGIKGITESEVSVRAKLRG